MRGGQEGADTEGSKAHAEESHMEGEEVPRSGGGQMQQAEGIGVGRQEVRAQFWKVLHEARGRRMWSEGDSPEGLGL